MKRRDLERHLRAHGARVLDEGANHTRWARGLHRSAVPRHREIGPGLARSICRQLGVPPPPGSRCAGLGRSAARGSVQVVQVVVDDVMVRLDGEVAWSETTVTTAGPWAMTLITVVPELGVRFISSYVGGEHSVTGATHVLTHPSEGEVVQREHSRDVLPVTHARERCLLDHGAELQRLLVAKTGMHVAVDVPAKALTPEPH